MKLRRFHTVNGVQIPVATTSIEELKGCSYYLPNLSELGDGCFGLVAHRMWTGGMEDLLFQEAGLCYPKTDEGYALAELYARSYLMVEKVIGKPSQDYSFCPSFSKQMANL